MIRADRYEPTFNEAATLFSRCLIAVAGISYLYSLLI